MGDKYVKPAGDFFDGLGAEIPLPLQIASFEARMVFGGSSTYQFGALRGEVY